MLCYCLCFCRWLIGYVFVCLVYGVGYLVFYGCLFCVVIGFGVLIVVFVDAVAVCSVAFACFDWCWWLLVVVCLLCVLLLVGLLCGFCGFGVGCGCLL